MPKITYLKALQILDSRGTPTVEVDMAIENGIICRASVPSGASTGKYEAVELRDGDKNYFGKSVLKAIENVNVKIKDQVINNNYDNAKEFDNKLLEIDGSENKSILGANAVLACSLALLNV